jgi:HEAT repeat protein
MERARQLCVLLLGALARHSDPAIAQAAMELVDDHGVVAAWAAVGSADRAQLVRLADLLGGESKDLFPVAVAAAVKLGPDESFKRLSAPLAPKGLLQKLKSDKRGAARMDAVLEYFSARPSAIDQRWRDFFLEVLQKGSHDHAVRVVGVLGNARERRAVPTLLSMLAEEKKQETLTAIIHALGEIGDKLAVDPILARIGVHALRGAIQQAVLAINDPASVDKVRTIYARQKDPDASGNWHIRSLLRTLENRFPGS